MGREYERAVIFQQNIEIINKASQSRERAILRELDDKWVPNDEWRRN